LKNTKYYKFKEANLMLKASYKLMFVFVFWLACGNLLAGEKINKVLEVSADAEVEVHNTRGNITIEGWDKNQVVVKGELDDLTERFVFETNDNKTLIKVVLPNRNSNARSGSGSDLQIIMPKSGRLQFGGVSTDIEVRKIAKEVDISSVSGDVKLTDIQGKAYINSVSGDIVINGVADRLNISTVSGDVDAKVSAQSIEVSGVSADIKVTAETIESAQIETVSGNTSLRGQLTDSGSIRLSNVSGKSIYFSQAELNARIILDTGPGGDIVNRISDHEPSRSFIGSEKLKFTLGQGSAQIRMSTVSGEIELRSQN
jgi:putative adhesin